MGCHEAATSPALLPEHTNKQNASLKRDAKHAFSHPPSHSESVVCACALIMFLSFRIFDLFFIPLSSLAHSKCHILCVHPFTIRIYWTESQWENTYVGMGAIQNRSKSTNGHRKKITPLGESINQRGCVVLSEQIVSHSNVPSAFILFLLGIVLSVPEIQLRYL